MNGPIINDRLASLPRTRPPGYWAVSFTDAQLRAALDPKPTEADELIRTELARRAKLPVVANPAIDSLPTAALRGWGMHFSMLANGAQTFEELYPASRALDDVTDTLGCRALGLEPEHDPDPVRLFDAWQS